MILHRPPGTRPKVLDDNVPGASAREDLFEGEDDL